MHFRRFCAWFWVSGTIGIALWAIYFLYQHAENSDDILSVWRMGTSYVFALFVFVANFTRGRRIVGAIAAIAILPELFVLYFAALGYQLNDPEWLFRSCALFADGGLFVAAFLMLQTFTERTPRVGALRRIAIVVWFTELCVTAFGEFYFGTMYAEPRLEALLLIPLVFLVATALMIPALRFLDTRAKREIPSDFPMKTELRCPRCGTTQFLSRGKVHCNQCGLQISLDFEDPRCICGYLLAGLSSDVCPECGKSMKALQAIA